MVGASRRIRLNRAPVLTLWAAVAAERLNGPVSHMATAGCVLM